MQYLKERAFTAVRAATAVVAKQHIAHRQQCSTEFYSWRSQSSYPKRPSISPRYSQKSSLSTAAHIPRATKDDGDAIAPPARAAAAAAEPYMPEEWPDFSKKEVVPGISIEFFHRKNEYDMIMAHLDGEPSIPLLLLGPPNSGKSVRHAN
jgi:hypothetical protein